VVAVGESLFLEKVAIANDNGAGISVLPTTPASAVTVNRKRGYNCEFESGSALIFAIFA